MFVKKFDAPTLEEALQKVKGEFGPSALILSTFNHKGSLMKKGYVEVTAALEKKAPPKKDDSLDREELQRIFPYRKNLKVEKKSEVRRELERKEYSKGTRYIDIGPDPIDERSHENGRIETPKKVIPSKYAEQFLRMGFSPESAKELSDQLMMDYAKSDLASPSFFDKARIKLIASHIKCFSTNALMQRRAWIPIGAPGVGKTSFLVRMAVYFKNQGIPVSLTSRDRRKLVGASEMAAYARVMKIPFLFDLKEAKGDRVSLIDSPSLSYEKNDVEEEIKRVFSMVDRHSVFLVIDATARLSEMLRLFDAANRFMPEAVAFTKCDLATNQGTLFDFLRRTRLPLLGCSLSQSFQTPLSFMNANEAAQFILGMKGKRE